MKNSAHFACSFLMVLLFAGQDMAFPQTAADSLFVDKIVFDSGREGSRQIYIMNTDGSSLKKLTSGTADNMCPSISPDGLWIVFESKRDGNYEVYTMKSDGTSQKRLTNSTEDEFSQEFSPDGTKIYFIKYFDTRSEIWVMNADGTGKLRLTNNQAHDERPRLSPDGQTIMFMSDRDGHYEIYFMDPDGTNQRRFTNSDGQKIFPAWSPDGSKIAYSIIPTNGTPTGGVYVINANGTGNTRLTNAPGASEDACWSPDCNNIVFQSSRDGNFEIYTMKADGSNQQRLTTNPSWDGWPCWGRIRYPINKYLGQAPPSTSIRRFPPTNLQMLAVNNVWMWHGSPAFSPDYKEMFFVKYQRLVDRAEIWHSQLVNNLWTIPEPAAFGNQTVTENCPVFSTTGDTLFFYSQRSAGAGIYQTTRQPAGTWSEPQHLVTFPNSGWSLSMARNRTIYFDAALTPGNADIYCSKWINGGYSQPERLPDQVNSLENEGCPYIDPDEEYLIFISKQSGGSGLHDIYISYGNKDGSWTQSVNLGTWINSDQEDGFPTVSPEGKYLFFNTVKTASADQGYNAYWVSAAFIDLMRPVEPDTANRVVFSSDRDGNPEIYDMFSDGTDLKRLTSNLFSDLYPAFSSDGKQIVFSSDREGNFELFLMNADGTNPRQLTRTGLQVSVPDWSPDGRQIVFIVSDDIESEEGEIGVIGHDGSGYKQLTGAGQGSRPVWSDDGTSILFCSKRSGQSEIYSMDSDGSNVQQITRSAGNKHNARLSPDGKKIVFTQISPAGTDAQIHVINADGTGERVLTREGNRNDNAVWSADGQCLFFQTIRFGNSEIYRMDADGKYQVNLSRNSGEDNGPNTIRKATLSGITDPGESRGEVVLKNFWPNPAEDAVMIEFSLAQPGPVDILVVDALGRRILTLLDADQPEGNHMIKTDLASLSSGVYSLILISSYGHAVRKFIKS